MPALPAATTDDPRKPASASGRCTTRDSRVPADAVYRRERLLAGHRLPGPAIVEQMDSTTVILGGQEARVDDRANLVIQVGSA